MNWLINWDDPFGTNTIKQYVGDIVIKSMLGIFQAGINFALM